MGILRGLFVLVLMGWAAAVFADVSDNVTDRIDNRDARQQQAQDNMNNARDQSLDRRESRTPNIGQGNTRAPRR